MSLTFLYLLKSDKFHSSCSYESQHLVFCFFVILRLRLWQNIHIQNLPNYLSYNNNNYYYLMYNKYYYFWQSLAGRPRLTILQNYFVRNTANLASRGKLFVKSKLFLVTNHGLVTNHLPYMLFEFIKCPRDYILLKSLRSQFSFICSVIPE